MKHEQITVWRCLSSQSSCALFARRLAGLPWWCMSSTSYLPSRRTERAAWVVARLLCTKRRPQQHVTSCVETTLCVYTDCFQYLRQRFCVCSSLFQCISGFESGLEVGQYVIHVANCDFSQNYHVGVSWGQYCLRCSNVVSNLHDDQRQGQQQPWFCKVFDCLKMCLIALSLGAWFSTQMHQKHTVSRAVPRPTVGVHSTPSDLAEFGKGHPRDTAGTRGKGTKERTREERGRRKKCKWIGILTGTSFFPTASPDLNTAQCFAFFTIDHTNSDIELIMNILTPVL